MLVHSDMKPYIEDHHTPPKQPHLKKLNQARLTIEDD